MLEQLKEHEEPVSKEEHEADLDVDRFLRGCNGSGAVEQLLNLLKIRMLIAVFMGRANLALAPYYDLYIFRKEFC